MLYLSHQTATVNDEIVATSSLGSFLDASVSMGLGSWVLRSPRVPSLYRVSLSAAYSAFTDAIYKSSSSVHSLISSSYGFDVSISCVLDSINDSVSGTACFSGIRFNILSGYIEIGRYKTSLGHSYGIRSTIGTIQTFGDLPTSDTKYSLRFAKAGNTIYIYFNNYNITIPCNIGTGTIELVSYGDASYETHNTCYIYDISVTPSTLIGDTLAATTIVNDRVSFAVPSIASGQYNVAVHGYNIVDSGSLSIVTTGTRLVPSGFGLVGRLSGDREIR